MSQTATLHVGTADYLVDHAKIVRRGDDTAMAMGDWDVDQSSPFITWIAGNFVEGDNPNSNKQYFTAGDLELAEYSIKYAPMNMLHKFRTPVGFYAATKNVKLERPLALAALNSTVQQSAEQGSMKIQVLGGLWSHIFPFETALVEAADAEGTLFYSMESRGTHLICAGDNGCGETFDYMRPDTHCAHLMERSSIRHIVNPTFRGGALLTPPTKPGWTGANASIVGDAVMQEAATFAEQNEAAYRALEDDGVTMTAAGWESLMSLVIATAVGVR